MRKEYILLSKAWYGKTCLEDAKYKEEITFSVLDEENGLIGEVSVEWHLLNNKLSPKINIFSDAWRLFGICNDLFLTLSRFNNKDVSPEEFIKCLEMHGFKDVTPLTKE